MQSFPSDLVRKHQGYLLPTWTLVVEVGCNQWSKGSGGPKEYWPKNHEEVNWWNISMLGGILLFYLDSLTGYTQTKSFSVDVHANKLSWLDQWIPRIHGDALRVVHDPNTLPGRVFGFFQLSFLPFAGWLNRFRGFLGAAPTTSISFGNLSRPFGSFCQNFHNRFAWHSWQKALWAQTGCDNIWLAIHVFGEPEWNWWNSISYNCSWWIQIQSRPVILTL